MGFLQGYGRAEQETLDFIATFVPSHVELIAGLDTFGGGCHSKISSQADYGAYDRQRLLTFAEPANEVLIDFDPAEGENSQIVLQSLSLC
jgi:hypothetical protein